MLAKADRSIAVSGMDHLVSIGLGEQGHKDFGLAKYTCIALQQCVTDEDWKNANAANGGPPRLAVTHEVISHLINILMIPIQTMEWFGVAEQAVKAINDLCESPDIVFGELIRVKTREVFSNNELADSDRQWALSQLLFIAGDVALKVMVHLERSESLFKRAKLAQERAATANKDPKQPADDNDLEMVGGGTSEDDYTEAITYIREKELLFGERSILTKFGALVTEVCLQGLQSKQVCCWLIDF
jgi:condensin complex subunit 1